MQELKNQDLESFYDVIQEATGQCSLENLAEEKIDDIYNNAIQNIKNRCDEIKQVLRNNPPNISGVYPPLHTLKLEEAAVMKSKEMQEDKILDECKIRYLRGQSLEHIIWMLALITTSWTLRNLKGKVEIGSCHNFGHTHGTREPRMCRKSSKFHKRFYDDCLKTFEDILRLARENPPVVISS